MFSTPIRDGAYTVLIDSEPPLQRSQRNRAGVQVSVSGEHFSQSPDTNSVAGANGVGSAVPRRFFHRRFQSSGVDSLSDLREPMSPSLKLQHAAQETWLLLRLGVQLWSYLGLGWRWTVNFWRLLLYTTLLLPGFIRMIIYYMTSPRVQRSVAFGRKPRQMLDIYTPASGEAPFPVVIFVTGGAWTIGYKAWGALLGRRLCAQGVMVACLDYRNFPMGTAECMLEDVNTGIAWVMRKIERHGGDPDNVTLVGQSAGGQLAALALIRQAQQAASGAVVAGASPSWHPLSVKAFIGVSGAYDLPALAEHLHKRGLYKELLAQVMSVNGRPAMKEMSPVHALKTPSGLGRANLAPFMPPVVLIHGTEDKSVPAQVTLDFHDALRAAGVSVSSQLVEGKTHTSFLLEEPMCGGRDLLTDEILMAAKGHDESISHASMCPRFLCRMAGYVCPF